MNLKRISESIFLGFVFMIMAGLFMEVSLRLKGYGSKEVILMLICLWIVGSLIYLILFTIKDKITRKKSSTTGDKK